MPEGETIDVFLPGRGLTETYDVSTLQRKENWVRKVNEAILKELKEEDPLNITSFLRRDILQRKEVLERIASVYKMLIPHRIIEVEEFINKEREENLRVYHEHKAEFHKRYAGKYVVIAKGEVQAVRESFDDLKYIALDANHRFIFKVEPKGKVRGTLRWPIKRK